MILARLGRRFPLPQVGSLRRRSGRHHRPGGERRGRKAVALVVSGSLLWQFAAAAAPPPSTAATGEESLASPQVVLADPLLQEISGDLQASGYVINPSYVEQRKEGEYLVGALVIEGTGAVTRSDPLDPQWGRAVPFLLLVFQRENRLEAAVQVRIDGDQSAWLMEVSSPRQQDMRVRLADPFSPRPDAPSRLQFLARLPDGTFDRLEERPDGSLYYANHPGVAVPAAAGGFKACMKQCFLNVQVTLTWLQGICMAACLLAAGITAIASGGAAATPVVIGCLKACGLAFLIVRAVQLVSCLIACALG